MVQLLEDDESGQRAEVQDGSDPFKKPLVTHLLVVRISTFSHGHCNLDMAWRNRVRDAAEELESTECDQLHESAAKARCRVMSSFIEQKGEVDPKD